MPRLPKREDIKTRLSGGSLDILNNSVDKLKIVCPSGSPTIQVNNFYTRAYGGGLKLKLETTTPRGSLDQFS